jgi:hypothetical protein
MMVPSNARPWGRCSVYRILTNEKYAGCNIYGKTTQRLNSVSRVVERHLWSRHPDAFVPIVDLEIFDRAQKFLKKRGAHPERSDAYVIQGMKKVLAREGKLTHRILKKKGILGCGYYKRFGSVMKAYEMAGYRPPFSSVKVSNAQIRLRFLRKDLYIRLKQLFSDHVRFISLPGQQMKMVVEIDGRLRVAVYLCRTFSSKKDTGWLLRLRPLDAHLPALICTVDQSFSELLNFYVLPPPGNSLKSKIFREGQSWLSAGQKLGSLGELCEVANDVASHSTNCEGYTVIDDALIATDTWTITLCNKEISLGPIGSPIFNLLAQNSGQVVSRDRLRRTMPQLMDSSNLDAHMYTLRVKLGVAGRRIQTVRGVGYMYVEPDKVPNAGLNEL